MQLAVKILNITYLTVKSCLNLDIEIRITALICTLIMWYLPG